MVNEIEKPLPDCGKDLGGNYLKLKKEKDVIK
jgi:hypothetical protein